MLINGIVTYIIHYHGGHTEAPVAGLTVGLADFMTTKDIFNSGG